MSKSYGWAGNVLRVNLTSGEITTESTDKYKDYIGGMGIGYKVMWDEVPKGTHPHAEENRLVFGAGPLTGSGMPCSGRCNITSLLPTNKYNLVSDSHMGGHFAPAMKYAGYDAIVVYGKSPKPVWLKIEDDKVTLEDATGIWGNGIFKTTAQIAEIMGQGAQVAAIGQAGENLVNMSVIMTGKSHSAGGHGSVMGSKNLKAIGVKGTNPVHIAADSEEWVKLDEYMMTLFGANNNHVVPRYPQPWAEYTHPNSRWTAKDGLYWGGANPPVNTGTCEPSDMNSVGYRTQKGHIDLGADSEKNIVRMGGCHACPIRCHAQARDPQLKKYGYSENIANTCMGWYSPNGVMNGKQSKLSFEEQLLCKTLGASLADDYGVWCNYGQIGRDFAYAYDTGILKDKLSAEEYAAMRIDQYEAGNAEFLIEFYRRIAFKEGEFGVAFGMGTGYVAERWNFGDDFYHGVKHKIWNPKLAYPVHHSNETNGQVGALISCMFNRDAQCHSMENIMKAGVPIDIIKQNIAAIPGVGSGDAADAPLNYTPVNEYKARFAAWSIIRNILHDSLTVCNWMMPLAMSPLKERNYKGDTSIESKFYSLATGQQTSEAELDFMGARIFTLHRALTVKQMGTVDMRNEHDVMADWIFDKDPDQKAFTEGTDKMDRDDMQLGLTMLYKEMDWDETTGAPTKAGLIKYGLDDVAAELEKLNLLP